jgi:hypothetical protein
MHVRQTLKSLKFLSTFANLGNATISFIMSDRLSARKQQFGPTDLPDIRYLSILEKSVSKISTFTKI